jgi:hypothetical protein
MEAQMKRGIDLCVGLATVVALCIVPPMAATTAVAALLASTVTARAQDVQVGVSPHKTGAAHDSRARHRKRAEPATGDYKDESSASIPRLPNFFRNCEHPAPRWCNDNY